MERYNNYKDYVNALGKRGEISMMSFSLAIYVFMTLFLMILICTVVLWEYISKTLLIAVPVFFAVLIIFFYVWDLKLEKTVLSTPKKALLFNGVLSIATSGMLFSVNGIMCYFGEIEFSKLHIFLCVVFIGLLILGSIYLYKTCRNGKKKKHSRKQLIAAISAGVVFAGLGRHLSKGIVFNEEAKGMSLSICLLILGFFELVCAIIELSRYYVACKYKIELAKKI